MKPAKKIEKQALSWYVKMQSSEFNNEKSQAFLDWLAESSANQAAFLRIEQAWIAGDAIQEIENKNAWSLTNQVYAGAIAICFIFACTLFLINLNLYPLEESAYSTHQQISKFDLADGSKLTLHNNSKVLFHNSVEQRALTLIEGTIYLEVAKLKGRPFFVLTENTTTKVLGTKFSVTKQGSDIEVTVTEGQVGLLPKSEDGQAAPPLIVLEQNQQIKYSEAMRHKLPRKVNANRHTQWQSGKLVFNQQPLHEVIKELNRHLAMPIVFNNPELEQTSVVGVISITNPQDAANTLSTIIGAHFKIDESNNQIEMYIKGSEKHGPEK